MSPNNALDSMKFVKSSFSGGDPQACVEISYTQEAPQVFARDSKVAGTNGEQHLPMSPGAFASFRAAVTGGQLNA